MKEHKLFGLFGLFLAGCLYVNSQEAGSNAFTAFGGSVKWQNSNTSIRQFVSELKIHIYSLPDDTLRQVVHVLPNGAYSVIVSDKGRYKIRLSAPHGWSFLPNDGYTIELSKNGQEDHMNYVFNLTGFDVSGQVVTMGLKTGPPGLVVTALSNDHTVVSHTKTKADGSFTLVAIPPGKYLITAGDSVSKGESDARVGISVTVSTNSLELAEPLVLEGHSLRSRVMFNGRGFGNIPVVLFSSKSVKLSKADFEKLGCFQPTKPLDNLIPADLKELINSEGACQAVSANDGSFTFSRLAGGEYFLVAFCDPALMKSSEIKSNHLELSPSFLRVTMEHSDQQIEPGFQVKSYRLSGGKVKQVSGKPIADADIIVNGIPVAKTDVTGSFELDLSSSAEYEIQPRAPGLTFEKVSVNLTPSTETLPAFTPKEVEICGKFVVSSSLIPGARFPDVEVAYSPPIQPSVSDDSASARFCAFLSPNKHILRLAKASNFIPFAPSSVNVDLSSGPITDLVFTQFQALLKGEVICIDKCPVLKLAARLSSKDWLDSKFVIGHLEADKDDEKRATFSFQNVTPGSYDLELVTEDSDQVASGWCWSSPGLLRRITVADQDLYRTPELVFRQTGYRLHVDVPLLDFGFKKPVDFKVTPLVTVNGSSTFGKPSFYRLTKSLNKICLPAGSFSFEASTSCLKLENPSPSSIESADIPISLPPKTVLLSVCEVPITAAVIAQPEIEGYTDENSLPEVIIQAQVADSVRKSSAKWKKEGSVFVSRMSLWASPDSEVVLSVSPVKQLSDTDAVYPLVNPESQTLRVPSVTYLSTQSTHDGTELHASATAPPKIDESDCETVLETTFGGSGHLSSTFSMKFGLFFTGTVQPAVANALVTVHADPYIVLSPPLEVTPYMTGLFSEEELNPPPPKPDFILAARALTDARGAFRIGPFFFENRTVSPARPPNSFLILGVHKPGFEFTQKSGFDWLTFKARKLALVEIRVVSEENREPLPDTLISIIGSVYRDSRTTDSIGFVRYIGLPPGEYYIQPILKEYDFFVSRRAKDPLESTMEYALSVVDGESLSVNLVGRRVAYSALGEVTSLSGHPEVGVLVEAKLLSSSEMNAYSGRSILPTQSVDSGPNCQRSSNEAAMVHPVEQSVTDDRGLFKLPGLLPGCPYLVTASSKENGSDYLARQVFPTSIIVKPPRLDVHDLRFFLKPRVSMGMISATVATDHKYLPELSIVIHPISYPHKPLIRHRFSSQPRFFSLLGSQVESLIGGTYVIQLETNGNQDQGHSKIIQKFDFSVDEKSVNAHQHFNFAYQPSS